MVVGFEQYCLSGSRSGGNSLFLLFLLPVYVDPLQEIRVASHQYVRSQDDLADVLLQRVSDCARQAATDHQTVCFVGGDVADPGTDTLIERPTPSDSEFLQRALSEHLPAKLAEPGFSVEQFKKVVAGRKLWNFDKQDWKT